MDKPPLMLTKHGEQRMPSDLWSAACEMVESYVRMQDDPTFADQADSILCTMIASRLLMERERGLH